MLIVVMGCGENMNKRRKVSHHSDLPHWDKIFRKMEQLRQLMSIIRKLTNDKSYFDESTISNAEYHQSCPQK